MGEIANRSCRRRAAQSNSFKLQTALHSSNALLLKPLVGLEKRRTSMER